MSVEISLPDIIKLINLRNGKTEHCPLAPKIIPDKMLRQSDTCSIKNICDPFDEIFGDINPIRYGIRHYIKLKDKTVNISLYSSFLHVLVPEYDILTEAEQINKCQALREYICGQLYSSLKKNYQRYNWKISSVVAEIKQYVQDNKLVQILADLFYVNIFVFNTQSQRIDVYFGHSEKTFNPFKINILLSFLDDIYEPIFLRNNFKINKHMSYPHPIISNIISKKEIINWTRPDIMKKKKNSQEPKNNIIFTPELKYPEDKFNYEIYTEADIYKLCRMSYILNKKIDENL